MIRFKRTFLKKTAVTSIFMSTIMFISGCTYHGSIKQDALSDNLADTSKSKTKITLIKQTSGIKDVDFKMGPISLDYDVKEPYFNAVKDMLKSIYSQVEIDSVANSDSKMKFVPYFETNTTFSSDSNVGIDTHTKVDVLDGVSNQLIKSYQYNYHINYDKPASVPVLGFLTGLTLFAISPITVPIVLNTMGEHGQELLEVAMHESLTNIRAEIIQDEKIDAQSTSVDECFDKLGDEPSLSILKGKISLSRISGQSLDILSNKNFPTEQEKVALNQWNKFREVCYAELYTYLSNARTPASLIALYGSTKTANDNNLVQLYNGVITYGDFAKRRKDINDAMVAAEAQIKQELAKQSVEANFRASQIASQVEQANAAKNQAYQMENQTNLMRMQTINQSMQAQQQLNLQQQQIQNQNTNNLIKSLGNNNPIRVPITTHCNPGVGSLGGVTCTTN